VAVAERDEAASSTPRLQATVFATTFDRFAMPPLLVAMARDLGASLATVAAAAGAYFLVYGVLQPFWGLVTDRLGLARTIRWAVLGGTLATGATALADDIATLTAARVAAAVCFSAAFPSTITYVGEVVAVASRQREISRLMTGVALGTAAGTVAAGMLAGTVGWRWAFVLSGLVGLVTTWLVWSLAELDPVRTTGRPWTPMVRVLRNRTAVVLLVLVALEGAGLLGAFTFVPAAVESTGPGPTVASAAAGAYGLAVLAGSLLVGRLAGRVAASRFIAVGGLLGAAGCALVAVTHAPAAAAVTCVLLGLCWAALHSSLQTWATEVAPAERSTAVALFAGSLFAGTAAAAWVGGALAGLDRYALLFGGCAVLCLLVGCFGSLARGRWERAG